MDDCMIYVEKFPDQINHEQLTSIFRRAGKIRHVSLPKFKNSKNHKGFAFIEYSTKEEAQKAIEMFNNTIANEFIDINHPQYINYEGGVKALRVISKNEWNQQK